MCLLCFLWFLLSLVRFGVNAGACRPSPLPPQCHSRFRILQKALLFIHANQSFRSRGRTPTPGITGCPFLSLVDPSSTRFPSPEPGAFPLSGSRTPSFFVCLRCPSCNFVDSFFCRCFRQVKVHHAFATLRSRRGQSQRLGGPSSSFVCLGGYLFFVVVSDQPASP